MTWKVSYTIKDEKGNRAIMGVNITAVNLIGILDAAANPLQYASELALYIEPLISGQIVAINVNIAAPLPAGLKSAPEITSDVEEGATFVFITADKYAARVRVPTFRESLQTGEAVTQDNAAVADFVMMVTLPEELAANWSIGGRDSRGVDLVALKSARANFKRSRR